MNALENPITIASSPGMKRILFVDDEPAVLAGLRDSLRSHRRAWGMRFALGGEAALEELRNEPVDVVVSDMRMPVMDGATLLAHVQRLYPETIRIVLSGYADVAVAVRAAAVAHLFLAKPCDVETLRTVIERACSLQSLLREEGARRAAAGAATLPSRPAVYEGLRAALREPGIAAADVAAIVEQDIAMSAKVLQLVNSAFFGLGRRISNIGEAVSYLGLNTLEAVVVSAAAFEAFQPTRRVDGFDIDRLQRHGLLVADIARRLVDDKDLADDLYTAGILHDIGLLVLAAQEPGLLEAGLAAARASGRPLHRVERENRNLTHAEVGAYLLGLWGLPHTIVEAVAHHHDPRRVPGIGLDCITGLHVANQLAHEYGSGALADVSAEPLDERLLQEIGVHDRLPAWRAIAAEEARDR